jgi:hypothetical protein
MGRFDCTFRWLYAFVFLSYQVLVMYNLSDLALSCLPEIYTLSGVCMIVAEDTQHYLLNIIF